MIDPNMWVAAAKVAASAIDSTMGGANQAMAGDIRQGGNISFGSKTPEWMLPALALVAVVFLMRKK